MIMKLGFCYLSLRVHRGRVALWRNAPVGCVTHDGVGAAKRGENRVVWDARGTCYAKRRSSLPIRLEPETSVPGAGSLANQSLELQGVSLRA
jgi:hypothetical protein